MASRCETGTLVISILLFSRFGEVPGTASWTSNPPTRLVGQPSGVQLIRSARRRLRMTRIEKTQNPPPASRGGLTLARPVSLPTGRIPFREPPCPGRQVVQLGWRYDCRIVVRAA